MRKHTLSGDICYEPFCGSGSQIVAGEQWGRIVYAMEIEPIFVDIAVERWERFSGRSAARERQKVIEDREAQSVVLSVYIMLGSS